MGLESGENSNDNDKLQQQIGTHDIRLTELNFNRHRVGSHFYLASVVLNLIKWAEENSFKDHSTVSIQFYPFTR